MFLMRLRVYNRKLCDRLRRTLEKTTVLRGRDLMSNNCKVKHILRAGLGAAYYMQIVVNAQ